MSIQANFKDILAKISLGFGLIFIAIIFGLVATTANPTIITLAIGMVVGFILLVSPKITVTLLLSLGLVVGVIASLAGNLFGKLSWGITMLGFSLYIPAFFSIFSRRKNVHQAFVWLSLIFLIYAVVVSLFNWDSFIQFLAGFKRYFQVYGLIFAFAFLPFAKKDIVRWQLVVLVIGLLQLPFALYELLVLVPQRGGLDVGGYVLDVVAGTFGANITGGSPNSVMVTFLLIIFSFLFSRWRYGLINTKLLTVLGFLLLLPLALGETKIVLVMIPLVWFVLIRYDFIKSPVKYIPVLFSGIVITLALFFIYITFIYDASLADIWEESMEYNIREEGYGTLLLNRKTTLTFWAGLQGMHDPLGLFFGNGIGSSFYGDIPGSIGLRYPGYGIDLTVISTMLWDVGVVGVVLFLSILVSAWLLANKIYRETISPTVKADILAIQAALSLFALLLIYSKDLVILIGMEIIFSLILGYLAYLHREHVNGLVRVEVKDEKSL